jgi:hypothetical protein
MNGRQLAICSHMHCTGVQLKAIRYLDQAILPVSCCNGEVARACIYTYGSPRSHESSSWMGPTRPYEAAGQDMWTGCTKGQQMLMIHLNPHWPGQVWMTFWFIWPSWFFPPASHSYQTTQGNPFRLFGYTCYLSPYSKLTSMISIMAPVCQNWCAPATYISSWWAT